MSNGTPAGEWSSSKAAEALHQTLKEFSVTAAKQTEAIIALTTWLLVLAMLMTIAVIVEIFILLRQLGWRWH